MLQPSQEVSYLGFAVNLKEMLVTLTSEKREKYLSLEKVLTRDSFTIRELSSLNGFLKLTIPGNVFGSPVLTRTG